VRESARAVKDQPEPLLLRRLCCIVDQQFKLCLYIGCARHLGRDQELGSIEPGKLADFLLLRSDPTKDLKEFRQVRMVVKNGDVLFPEEVNTATGIEPFGRKPRLSLPATRLHGAC
jgi:predicted amidohydrolase YtcJ